MTSRSRAPDKLCLFLEGTSVDSPHKLSQLPAPRSRHKQILARKVPLLGWGTVLCLIPTYQGPPHLHTHTHSHTLALPQCWLGLKAKPPQSEVSLDTVPACSPSRSPFLEHSLKTTGLHHPEVPCQLRKALDYRILLRRMRWGPRPQIPFLNEAAAVAPPSAAP